MVEMHYTIAETHTKFATVTLENGNMIYHCVPLKEMEGIKRRGESETEREGEFNVTLWTT